MNIVIVLSTYYLWNVCLQQWQLGIFARYKNSYSNLYDSEIEIIDSNAK